MQRHEPGASQPATGDGALPLTSITADLCVIGAGSGGLSVAAAAAAFGRSVVLIEKHKMGGDCLNYGCVPSKALIAAARRAHVMRSSGPFGVTAAAIAIDHKAVRDHVADVKAAIAPNDSVERFTALGVRVVLGAARFLDARTVKAGEYRITARRFVVATGSSPVVPPIPGIDAVPYFTNETLFENAQPLDHLIIIGGGPLGVEMAQAYRRLDSRVTVIEASALLSRDDPELVAIVRNQLGTDGIVLREEAHVDRVEGTAGAIRVMLGGGEVVTGSHLLVAAGRKPNVSGLGLEAAGVTYTENGITVNAGLVTSNRRVFAIGDCTNGPRFTHVANQQAAVVIRRALFHLPAKMEAHSVPWVTYTYPELAHVGLTESQAVAERRDVRVLRWPYHENDRAQIERTTQGLIKIVTDGRGVILGASIVGEQAGELIQMWSLAISQRMKIKAMTEWISPYPTLSEIGKRAAFRYYTAVPGNALVRKAVDWLARLG